jgi:hypothetical protein
MENRIFNTAYPASIKEAILTEARVGVDTTESVILAEWGLRPSDEGTDQELQEALEETYQNVVETYPTLYFFTHEVQEEGYGLRHIDGSSYFAPWEFELGPEADKDIWNTMKGIFATAP